MSTSFPSDYRLAVKALNRGLPLVVDGNRAPLAAAFMDYAKTLAGSAAKEAARKEAPEKGAVGLLGMLTGRR